MPIYYFMTLCFCDSLPRKQGRLRSLFQNIVSTQFWSPKIPSRLDVIIQVFMITKASTDQYLTYKVNGTSAVLKK